MSDAADRHDEAWSSRLRVRLAFATVVFGLVLLWTAGSLVEVLDVLWPPGESLARWSTLVLLQLFGYVLLPLLVGGWIGDQVYDRWLTDVAESASGDTEE